MLEDVRITVSWNLDSQNVYCLVFSSNHSSDEVPLDSTVNQIYPNLSAFSHFKGQLSGQFMHILIFCGNIAILDWSSSFGACNKVQLRVMPCKHIQHSKNSMYTKFVYFPRKCCNWVSVNFTSVYIPVLYIHVPDMIKKSYSVMKFCIIIINI